MDVCAELHCAVQGRSAAQLLSSQGIWRNIWSLSPEHELISCNITCTITILNFKLTHIFKDYISLRQLFHSSLYPMYSSDQVRSHVGRLSPVHGAAQPPAQDSVQYMLYDAMI